MGDRTPDEAAGEVEVLSAAVSVDIFVQGFHSGAMRDADATALREALAPYLVEAANGWNLHVDNSSAEIYGVDDLTSFMVTHVDGVEIYDVLVRVAARFDLVLLLPGGQWPSPEQSSSSTCRMRSVATRSS